MNVTKLYKEIEDFSRVSSNYSLLILDNIEDPQNFGQIIRTAECTGVDGIIIPKRNSVGITSTVLQVSQGSFLNVPIYISNNLRNDIKLLKNEILREKWLADNK